MRPILAAFLLGVLATACAVLVIQSFSSSPRSAAAHAAPYVTLPTAYDIRTGRTHVVDPLDCRPADAGYSGRAVCSWVRNP